jgi:integrase
MQGHVRKRHKPDCARKQPNATKTTRCNCDGAWQGRYRLDGKFVERSFRLKADAEQWLQGQQADHMRGEWLDPRHHEKPFSEVVQAWRESWPNRIGAGTVSLYDSILETHINSKFASAPIGRIDRGVVQRWVNQLTADGLAPGTVRNAYACLRNALNTAVKLGYLKTNPCTTIDLPRARREEMLMLTPEEVKALANAIDKHYKTLVYVAAYSGLRAGELLALTRADVDVLKGTLTVRRSLKDVNGTLTLGEVKTPASRRTVTLPAGVARMLRDHLAKTQDQGGPASSEADALVFASKTGKPLRHRLFYRRHFKPAVTGYTKPDGTKVPGALPAAKHGLRFHDLRHTAASLAIHAGAHPLLVSKMLGHSSVQITLDRYSHLMPNVSEALAEKLDALFVAAEQPPEAANVVEMPISSSS